LSVVFFYTVAITMTANGLYIAEGRDFEALHVQLSTKFDRCTKLDL